MSLARELVQRLRAGRAQPLPVAVEAAARLHLLDAIGVGLAAAAGEAGHPYRHFAAEAARGGAASMFGQPHGAAAADAALVNGGLIHSLEFDDTHTASIVHGSAVLAPAALASAEMSGATGRSLLAAYARGWEVLVRMGLAAPGAFQSRGFQVTSVGGALVAALIGAELAGLDEDASVAALGVALSQASAPPSSRSIPDGRPIRGSSRPGWRQPA
jgi:2-methylcitrate dehydratase PrpD